ncbi:FliO/MopB family protein [Undibacterium sp. TJN25]|uniref:FliO/MopB family protein n=1 Tax=Undibacterium sp. TJN25 TaxID=3413056 RepID=UPI003BF1024C
MMLRQYLSAFCLVLAGLAMAIPCQAAGEELHSNSIPFKREPAASGGDFSRMAGGMTLVLLILAGGVYVVRRRLGFAVNSTRAKQLRIVESHRLTPKSSLHVVEFAGSQYMLAQSEQGVQCLVTVPLTAPNSSEPQ